MKCALCGAEWEKIDPHDKVNVHPGDDCPLARITPDDYDIQYINAAIEAARKDTRKPEECKGFIARAVGSLHVNCKKWAFSVNAGMCPCAAWERRE